jgi:Na+-transporting NADH:ubiquinone oxidoreductase subunit A
MIRIRKGLDLPIVGTPEQKISQSINPKRVALIAGDYVGMKPSLLVQEGEQIKKGQTLFEDKKISGVRFTSPVSGKVLKINRGEKRVFQSLEIEVAGSDALSFSSYKGSQISSYNRQEIISLLVESGEWTALRTRPFSKTPAIDSTVNSIFVTAIDTHPLAANPEVVIKEHEKAFADGLKVLEGLGAKIFVCVGENSSVKVQGEKLSVHEFSGPHPAGLVGTHIHFLDPVNDKKTVWHIGYQDVIAFGNLFASGELYNQRIISLAGPKAKHPRLLRVTRGTHISSLVQGELNSTAEVRAISGSVFGGRKAEGVEDYLGRFHNQIVLLEEGRERFFLGWHSPGLNRFSAKPIYLSSLLKKKFAFTTNTNGSLRSIVPIGSFEKVMPLDILPTQLLRYLNSANTEMCVKLGALELDEEDLSLCNFVDPCKIDYAEKLREKLTEIEKEG